ncbi:MAG TPA: L-seryl-tRNA(Sec) selenium transferase [Syntrophomonadaceae bacterium]|nr:L-seryl-tRNA(Sec) selenium transferase [Syntrophomonadaceae bacterium]
MGNLRNLPPVDEILLHENINDLLKVYNRHFVTEKVRQAINEIRNEVKNDNHDFDRAILTAMIHDRVKLLINHSCTGTLRKVINGTGVILHTNLGRSPLSKTALRYLTETALGYCNLEIDLATGERGSRYQHVEDLLIELTGAEAALVVNNNAAAVLLGLNTIADNREVIVSRGQLVEIGGSFRIPEVMKQSGAILNEVGTTNKTYISDFAEAINNNTALLFSAHPSNYRIVGFTEEVKLTELVQLGKEAGLPVMEDLGSGVLYDLEAWGLNAEPPVKHSVASGADIITFSGDKLLGGPQAGIIVGKKQFIDAMKKNQLTRALRVDKLTIAALEGTLLEYLKQSPAQEIPVLQMLTYTEETLQQRAGEVAGLLQIMADPQIIHIEIIPVEDMVGGGAYPVHTLPGYAVKLNFKDNLLENISKELRLGNPAVLTRKNNDSLLISVRTLLPGDDVAMVKQIARALRVHTKPTE